MILDASLRSGNGEDYGMKVSSLNTPQEVGFLGSTVTFWGTPGDPRHDNSVAGGACRPRAELKGSRAKPPKKTSRRHS